MSEQEAVISIQQAEFFGRPQHESQKGAEQAKALLAQRLS